MRAKRLFLLVVMPTSLASLPCLATPGFAAGRIEDAAGDANALALSLTP
jgi:hypothetical protein